MIENITGACVSLQKTNLVPDQNLIKMWKEEKMENFKEKKEEGLLGCLCGAPKEGYFKFILMEGLLDFCYTRT